jgi:nicotinate phosphoribosyltransferase
MAKRKAAKGKSKAKGRKKPVRKKSAQRRSVFDLPLQRSPKPLPKQERSKLERQLDEGLKQSFPASDPPAVVEPAPTPPGNDNQKPR